MKKGITLVSLVITIILILILAGVGIAGSLALIEEAKYTAFINEMKQINEAVVILIAEKQLEVTGTENKIQLFKDRIDNEKELNSLPKSVKQEIEYVRALLAKEEGIENNLPSSKEGNIEISEEEGKRIYFVDTELSGGKEYAYIYDEQSASVYKIEPTIIWEVKVHGYEYGNLLVSQPGLLEKAKNENSEEKEDENIVVLFDNGNQYEEITGGWTGYYSAGTNSSLGSVSIGENLRVETWGTWCSYLIRTNNAIDLSEYSIIVFQFESVTGNADTNYSAQYGVSTNPNNLFNGGKHVAFTSSSEERTIINFDITDITGDNYVLLHARNGGAVVVSKIYLIKNSQ